MFVRISMRMAACFKRKKKKEGKKKRKESRKKADDKKANWEKENAE